MASLLITRIKSLIGTHTSETRILKGNQMQNLPALNDAWLLIEDKKIVDFGHMGAFPPSLNHHRNQLNAEGKLILPAWCDSHTHLVFAKSREEEFVLKIGGKSYEEIAAMGGGILNSAEKLGQMSETELFECSSERLREIISLGTGAIEIKSGYGLTVEDELKMLRVIRKLKEVSEIPVKATFLAAHAFPIRYKENREGYIRLIIDEMLPQIHENGLADYIDVFCEHDFFTNSETSRILEAGAKYGLKPKIHANQFSASGAVETGVNHGALSVDHLEVLDNNALISIQNSNTIATLLPGCSLFLGIPFANARSLISSGVAVSLASDFNPGSAPSGNMNLIVSLACMRLKMSPEEAINAATLNGAAAMELSGELGSISKGKTANLLVTKAIPSVSYLPYSFGSNLIDNVIINGEII